MSRSPWFHREIVASHHTLLAMGKSGTSVCDILTNLFMSQEGKHEKGKR